MREYWVWELKLGRQKIKFKTFCDSKTNPCHRAIQEARKKRQGDEFYLSNGKIIRYIKDCVGTYSVKSVRNNPAPRALRIGG